MFSRMVTNLPTSFRLTTAELAVTKSCEAYSVRMDAIAALPLSHQHYLRNAAIVLGVVVLVVWTAFPFIWILMT